MDSPALNRARLAVRLCFYGLAAILGFIFASMYGVVRLTLVLVAIVVIGVGIAKVAGVITDRETGDGQ